MYLLDTDTCIYLINKQPISILEIIKSLSPYEVGISAITVAELEFGVEKSQFKKKNKHALEVTLQPFEIFDFTKTTAKFYGELRYDLEKRGKIIGANDMLIASHAKELKRTLVTNNEKEFKRIPGLKIQNWAKEVG